MRALFVDTDVLLVAFGGPHPARAACVQLLEAAGRGEVEVHLSVEAGQEFLFHRLRRSPRDEAVQAFDRLDSLAVWHDFDATVLRGFRRLVGDGSVRGRDAVHAATALLAGFDVLVSLDPDFEGVPGLRRLDPRILSGEPG